MNCSDLENEIEKNISEERKEELRYLWDNETNDEDTQDWREELTADEEALIDLWDNHYNDGIIEVCRAILEAERKTTEGK